MRWWTPYLAEQPQGEREAQAGLGVMTWGGWRRKSSWRRKPMWCWWPLRWKHRASQRADELDHTLMTSEKQSRGKGDGLSGNNNLGRTEKDGHRGERKWRNQGWKKRRLEVLGRGQRWMVTGKPPCQPLWPAVRQELHYITMHLAEYFLNFFSGYSCFKSHRPSRPKSTDVIRKLLENMICETAQKLFFFATHLRVANPFLGNNGIETW